METPLYILILLEEAKHSKDRKARTAYGIDLEVTDEGINLYKDKTLRVIMRGTPNEDEILAEFNELLDPEDR